MLYVNFLFIIIATKDTINTLDNMRLVSENDVTILLFSSHTCDYPSHICQLAIEVVTVLDIHNPSGEKLNVMVILFSTSLTKAKPKLFYISWFLRSTPLQLIICDSFLLHRFFIISLQATFIYLFIH